MLLTLPHWRCALAVTKALFSGCERGRMGLCRSLSRAHDAGCPPAHLLLTRGLQRLALSGQDGLPVARSAARFAALGGGLSTNPALVAGRCFCPDGAGLTRTAAPRSRTPRSADGRHSRQPHPAVHAGKWTLGGLGRSRASERPQSTCGGGHLGTFAGAPCHAGDRTGPGAGGRAGRSHSRSPRRTGRMGLCRLGVHRRGGAHRCPGARYPTGHGQTTDCEKRIYPAAVQVGGRALVCLDHALSTLGARLRTPAGHGCGPALLGFCLFVSRTLGGSTGPKSITSSSMNASAVIRCTYTDCAHD